MSEAVNRQFYSLPRSPGDHGEISIHQTSGNSNLAMNSTELRNKMQERFLKSSGLQPTGTEPCSSHINLDLDLELLTYIGKHVIGSNMVFSGPYGLRSALYLDFVASGRALKFIEDYIYNEVLPAYGNTHTTTSITSLQTTLFRHEARDIIRNACNASEHDSVIFIGSGTTGAVHKLVHGLHLDINKPCIVLTGPYEHHSNILPWIEAGAKVVRISETDSGNINLKELEECLQMLKDYDGQIFGTFNAASNITGVLTNVNEVTALLHAFGALSFWDYAAAAPYVKIDMNPYVGGSSHNSVCKDAVYFSMHKFVGGVDCPGVLIAKKSLFRNPSPSEPGGGTVFYVRRDNHRYLQEPEMREEGGTPAIVGSIRAGLVFQLREALGTDLIKSQDDKLLNQAKAVWSGIPNLVILGPSLGTTDRLPIFSIMVYHPLTGRFLHHNFVAAVLNDLFGIQSRGGCACAGPYAMDLLGLKESVSEKFEQLLVEDSKLDRIHLRRIGEYSHREFLRPGFVRINLPYFLDQDSVDFVLEAVSLVAEHAWKLLPQYLFNPETGEWRHKQFQVFKDRKWLGHISYASGEMYYHQPAQVMKGPLPASFQDCINTAKDIFSHAEKLKMKVPDQTLLFDDEVKALRWFVLPSEAYDCIRNKCLQATINPSQLPFCPPNLLRQLHKDVPVLTSYSAFQQVKEILFRLENHERKSFDNKPDNVNMSNAIDLDVLKPHGFMHEIKEIPFAEGMVSVLEHGFLEPESLEKSSQWEGQLNVDSYVKVNGGKQNISDAGGEAKIRMGSVSNKAIPNDKELSVTRDASSLKDTHRLVNVDNVKMTDLDDFAKEGFRLTDNSNSCSIEEKIHNDNPNKVEDTKFGLSSIQEKKKEISKWFSPPKSIFKPAVSALEEFNMLHDGDKVLICLSGGKDSLSLLHTMRQYKFYAKGKGINFEMGAVTIDPQTPSYDPSPLKEYLSSLNVPYFYESQCIMETANNLPYECTSICSFCSRMKRGRIYAAARREGYNVLALGQHLDDLAESFMMSFLHNGTLNTMKAHYTVKEGDLRVIRPFVYVREIDLRCFAEKNKLPVIAENCPACFEAPKERHRIKQLLATQEVMFPQVYNSMLSAMKPLMARQRQKSQDVPPKQSATALPLENGPNTTPDEDDFDL